MELVSNLHCVIRRYNHALQKSKKKKFSKFKYTHHRNDHNKQIVNVAMCNIQIGGKSNMHLMKIQEAMNCHYILSQHYMLVE